MCFRGLAFKEYFFNPPLRFPYVSGNHLVPFGKIKVLRRVKALLLWLLIVIRLFLTLIT